MKPPFRISLQNSLQKKQRKNNFNAEYVFYRFSFAKPSGHVFLSLFSENLQLPETNQVAKVIKNFRFEKSNRKFILNYTFISTSTPLGNSSFIKASIVLDEEL